MSTCPIWGTSCKDAGSTDEFFFVDSPRAGGKYKLFGSAQRQVMELTPDQKKAVTSWIIYQHGSGIAIPQIDARNIEEIKHRYPLNFSQRVDRALLFLASRTKIGDAIAIDQVSSQSREALEGFLAFTESADAGEAQSMLKMLGDDLGLVGHSQDTLFYLMPRGWMRVDELQRSDVQSSQAFIAMWFDQSTDEPYKNGLYRAVYDSGYDLRRIDQQHHHLNKVDDEIIAEIRRSRFLVADFTCAPGNVRGGVYFEAGFAMGLNIPIIWTCKDSSLRDLHFDTRQYPHIPWKDSADLYAQLKARIGAVIGDGPKRRLP
jgi:hypothetical protein